MRTCHSLLSSLIPFQCGCCVGVGVSVGVDLNRSFVGLDFAFKFFGLPNHFDISIPFCCPSPSFA